MRYNEKGSHIRRMQEQLMAQGYKLPRYGADGHLGEETWEALERFAVDQGIRWDPEIPIGVVDRLGDEPTRPEILTPPKKTTYGVQIFDLRSEQTDPSPKSKVVGGKTVRRALSSVNAITIHQTAIEFGLTKAQILEADGDENLALARRGLRVACHAMAFRRGFVAWTNELERYIHHGNGLNRRSLGLEIEGRYAGLEDDPSTVIREDWKTTWGGKPSTLTDEIILASRDAVKLLVTEGRKLGMPIKYIHAHRQSSANRRSDPGEALWREVVLEYAVPVLGLIPQPTLIVDDGRPIPREWDPTGGVGSY